jgi:hypothetical protein
MNKFYNFLKSQKLGILCGWGVAGLLALGSLVMNFIPSSYQGLGGEDIRFFFKNTHPLHFWFYLLFLCCVLYALNALLCTWDSLYAKIKAKVKWLPAYGASILHIAFLLTLLSHLVAGLGAEVIGRGNLSTEQVQAGPMMLRLVDLKVDNYPHGMIKTTEALVEYQWQGQTRQTTVGYNQPLTTGAGVWELLLLDQGQEIWGINVTINEEPATITSMRPLQRGAYRFTLQDIYSTRAALRMPVALVEIEHQGKKEPFYLPLGKPTKVDANLELTFRQVLSNPYITVNLKKNPAIPLVLAAIGVFLVGLPLVVWRIVVVRKK